MPAGRPSKYRPEFAREARNYCLLGATNAQLAEFFAVNESTIEEWLRVKADFAAAVKEGKDAADATVEQSLYRRACGYSHPAVKIFMPAGAKEPVYAPYTEEYPPDTQAATLWLKNRQPDHWKDKIEVAHDATDNLAYLLDAARSRSGAMVNVTPTRKQISPKVAE